MLLRCRRKTVELSRPVVMGVLNVTPDSFSDGGRFVDVTAAVAHALSMAQEGAAIIDVGGESTRPGANPINAGDEISRVIPVVEKLRAKTDVVISVDTSKPEVIRAAVAAGADLINDVRALREEGALEAVAATDCAVCLMHMKGSPQDMQLNPHYDDVVKEVSGFLRERIEVCRAAGVAADRIAIDPGFGFGKTQQHNLQLLRHLGELAVPIEGGARAATFPIMAGLSRKSTVGYLTGRPAGERVYGSVALAVIAALNGARIIRVHDVAATVDALKVVSAVLYERELYG